MFRRIAGYKKLKMRFKAELSSAKRVHSPQQLLSAEPRLAKSLLNLSKKKISKRGGLNSILNFLKILTAFTPRTNNTKMLPTTCRALRKRDRCLEALHQINSKLKQPKLISKINMATILYFQANFKINKKRMKNLWKCIKRYFRITTTHKSC